MKHISWARGRRGRFLGIIVALACYIFLLSFDASRSFPLALSNNSVPSWLTWLRFGFSAFVAFIFLAVGALVWLYARSRQVAMVLFGLSFAMMITFTVQTGAKLNDLLLSVIGLGSSGAALFLFSALLLVFPRNFLAFPTSGEVVEPQKVLFKRSKQHYIVLGLRGYLLILVVLCANSLFISTFYFSLSLPLLNLLSSIDNIYRLITLIGALVTVTISYFSSYSLRERQQRRLFVIGVILAVAPLLLLSVVPEVLQLPSRYIIDSQITSIPVVLIPLTLGYIILRYQVMVFDMYVRRVVALLAGLIGLTFLGYLVVMLSSAFLAKNISSYVIFVVIVMALLAPVIWWLAKLATERLFFSEIFHYRKLIDSPDIMSGETFDLNEAAQLLTLAAINTFETQEVCLFVLDEDTGCFQMYPQFKEDDPQAAARHNLAHRVLRVAHAAQQGFHKDADWLNANELFLQNLAVAHRPLLLNEAMRAGGELSLGVGRYLAGTTVLDITDPLLAPVLAQGKMIGFLVLGVRGDQQQYAGPDFEAIYHMLSRFSPIVETARLYVKASQHVAILNALYSGNMVPVKDFETIEDVAVAYTKIAAQATMAGVGIWLYNEQDGKVHFVAHEDTYGPRLVSQKRDMVLQEEDWVSCFFQGDSEHGWKESSAGIPSILDQTPCFPFAWIPLRRGKQPLGLLTLTYSRPHIFSQEEKRVLEMFASQCAVTLENAHITIELRVAYERQKELDHLKDQFIITASHELRTPLTAVLGYIELLAAYNESLALEIRADFIAKAHRGCDELSLMVNNIMDASRVQIDVENVKLKQVLLIEPVHHVLEILEAMTRREQRAIQVDIAADVYVMADTMRLRQVLLNLISNALKYSPQGSRIEISSELEGGYITIRVRDYGLGVPSEDQAYLFERFVRLERDMNSAVRGAGLGLYISKQLVVAMGGAIWVESSGIPNEGSIFTFTLKSSSLDSKTTQYALEHQEVGK